jgi:hypothetical protein
MELCNSLRVVFLTNQRNNWNKKPYCMLIPYTIHPIPTPTQLIPGLFVHTGGTNQPTR